MSENRDTNPAHQAHPQYTRDRKDRKRPQRETKIAQRPGNMISDFTSAIMEEK